MIAACLSCPYHVRVLAYLSSFSTASVTHDSDRASTPLLAVVAPSEARAIATSISSNPLPNLVLRRFESGKHGS